MLTQSELKTRLNYDAETGLFMRTNMRGVSKKGWMQGCPNADGYLVLGVAGKTYLSHRLAWLWVYGKWPTEHIDHINGNPADNRICNLREATRSLNMQNLRRAKTSNVSSGLLGVTAHKKSGKWIAQIYTNGRTKFLGYFVGKEDAHAAYLAAKRLAHIGNTL